MLLENNLAGDVRGSQNSSAVNSAKDVKCATCTVRLVTMLSSRLYGLEKVVVTTDKEQM
jgi:hypothetical protein